MSRIPDHIDGYGPVHRYAGAVSDLAPRRPARAPVTPRNAANLVEAIERAGLRDGATLSFHHQLRNGDDVIRQVLSACSELGLSELHIAASSLFPCHETLVPFLHDGTVTRITTSYMNGPLADAIAGGAMNRPVVLQTHGGRAHAIESGRLKIDAAFIAAPAVDSDGNLSGAIGPQACGPLGYAMVDASHAANVIAVTDHLAPRLPRVCIPATQMDQIVTVANIGDASQIVSGTTGRPVSAKGRIIADLASGLIQASGLLSDGFSFQTGAGATSLAVARALGPVMADAGVSGSFAAGGVTGPLVRMFQDGLFQALWDVQAFDHEAVQSYASDPEHRAMSASLYASPARSDTIAGMLDVMILGAAEVDLQFNVNVTQASNGRIIGGSGGHADTAAEAKLPIVTTTLTAGGYAKIVDRLTSLTTPGHSVGAVVTEAGIAVHPSRPELAERVRRAGLPLCDLQDLKSLAETECAPQIAPPSGERIVAVSEYRDGTVIDVIRAAGAP